jgi:hypothetical protein
MNEHKIKKELIFDKLNHIDNDDDFLLKLLEKNNEMNNDINIQYKMFFNYCIKRKYIKSALYLFDNTSKHNQLINLDALKLCIEINNIELIVKILNFEKSSFIVFQIFLYSFNVKNFDMCLKIKNNSNLHEILLEDFLIKLNKNIPQIGLDINIINSTLINHVIGKKIKVF